MRVMVDPGHGGRDPGAAAHGLIEKDIAMMYGDALFNELRNRGHIAALTRSADEDLARDLAWPRPGKSKDLNRRCVLANEFGAHAFISLHCNAGYHAMNGAWLLHCRGSHHGAALGVRIFDELSRIPGIADDDAAKEVLPDDSVHTGYTTKAHVLLRSKPPHMADDEWLYLQGLPRSEWYRTIRVLRGTKMPAVLVELGFLTNRDDARQLALPSTAGHVVRAIADGLEGWWDGD